MNKNKGFIGIGLIIAIVLGAIIIGGGAYYLGKSGSRQEVINPENILPNVENQNLPVVDNKNLPDFATLPNTYGGGDIKLLSFKAVNGNFVVETDYFNEHALIRVFADPTGTGIGELDPMTTGAFVGTMTPDLTNKKGNIKWTLSGSNFKDKITNHLYAELYFNGEASNLFINFPKDGVFGYEDIFPKKLISTTLPEYVGTHSDCGGLSSCWPPVISNSTLFYSCVPYKNTGDVTDDVIQKNINGRIYCVKRFGDGYAGGTGWRYTYTTANGNGTKTTTFGFTYQSCGVYGGPTDPTVIQCKNIQSNFSSNLDTLIDSLMFN